MSKNDRIIGKAYDQAKTITKRYAQNDGNVLFVGERGTGKEEFAKFYKGWSKRKNYSDLNCAAVSDSLIDSEIFGHEKGAFTGAHAKRQGLLKNCEKGILYLDEFGDASERFQATILRVAEGNSYRPVGADNQIDDYDVVIIASTNKLHKVRKDLQDRFKIIYIPNLQIFDIPRLAEHFVGGLLKKDYMEQICRKYYPGNIRELKKFCRDLSITIANEKLLCKKREYELYQVVEFDYAKYETEIELWSKHLQPLLEKFDLTEYMYRYEDFTNKTDRPEVTEKIDIIMKKLSNGEEVEKPEIKQMMDLCFKYQSLNYLFLNLSSFFEKKYHEYYRNYRTEYNISLSSLFKLKRKEAKKAFDRAYIRHYLQRCGGNVKSAAKEMGIKEAALYKQMQVLDFSFLGKKV